MTYDYDRINWFIPYEIAHTATEESLRFTMGEYEVGLLMQDCHRNFVETGDYPIFFNPYTYELMK